MRGEGFIMHPQAPAWGLQQAIELELVMQEIETVPVAAALLEAIRELDVSGWSYGSIEGGKRYGKATVSDKKLAATLREQRPQLAAGSSSASLRKEVGEARQLLLGNRLIICGPPWTAEEDERLVVLAAQRWWLKLGTTPGNSAPGNCWKHGCKSGQPWAEIATHFEGRTGKMCQQQWRLHMWRASICKEACAPQAREKLYKVNTEVSVARDTYLLTYSHHELTHYLLTCKVNGFYKVDGFYQVGGTSQLTVVPLSAAGDSLPGSCSQPSASDAASEVSWFTDRWMPGGLLDEDGASQDGTSQSALNPHAGTFVPRSYMPQVAEDETLATLGHELQLKSFPPPRWTRREVLARGRELGMRAELRGKLPGQSMRMPVQRTNDRSVVKHNPDTVLRSTHNLDTGVSHVNECLKGFNIV